MAEPLKNLYNESFITSLSNGIAKIYPAFEKDHFSNAVFNDDWNSLELKQRMRRITHQVHRHMETPYENQIGILKQVSITFSGFTAMLFPDFVEVFGLNSPDISIPALEHFTQYSSAEFAVRPFFLKYPGLMTAQHLKWATHTNHHVRRLASEGIRPRLPWAMALPFLKKDPSPILPILEILKTDSSEYVRRSVANNLNDISKDHPLLLLEIASQWKNKDIYTDRILKHACRGLLKKGNTSALSIFGYEHTSGIRIDNFMISKTQLKIGEQFEFGFIFEIEDAIPLKIRIEYIIGFIKATGKTSEKIFKITENLFEPQKKYKIKRRHSFADLTTRKHHPGTHYILPVINGQKKERLLFLLSNNSE